MADFIDRMTDVEELMHDVRVANARASAPTLKAIGKCYNCLEKLDVESAKFCDKYCCEDYEKRELRK